MKKWILGPKALFGSLDPKGKQRGSADLQADCCSKAGLQKGEQGMLLCAECRGCNNKRREPRRKCCKIQAHRSTGAHWVSMENKIGASSGPS